MSFSFTISAPAPLAVRLAVARPARRNVAVRAGKPDAKDLIAGAVQEAEGTCKDGTAQECAAAWDSVEEISAAASHAKAAKKDDPMSDPLEAFCAKDPSADECRVYED